MSNLAAIILATLVANSSASAQDVTTPPPTFQQLSEPISTYKLNFLLYGSTLPPSKKENPYRTRADALNQVLGLAEVYHWSALVRGNLFILWPEPDLEQLAQDFRQGKGYRQHQLARPATEILRDLNLAFRDIVAPNQTPDTERTLNATSLNKTLRDDVYALVRNRILDGHVSIDYSLLWLDGDIWNNSKLQYRPPTLRGVGSHPTLVASADIKDGNSFARLDLDILTGGITHRRLLNTDQQDAWQVPKPIPIEKRAPGNPTNTPQTSIIGEPAGSKLIKYPMTSGTLGEFVASLQGISGSPLQVSPEISQVNIVYQFSEITLNNALLALERASGARWIRDTGGTLTLSPQKKDPFFTALDRIGDFNFYRFGDINEAGWTAHLADFNQRAESLVQTFGDTILNPPGVSFKSLPDEEKQGWRRFVEKRITRDLLSHQLAVHSLAPAQIDINFSPKAQSYIILVNQKPQFMIRDTNTLRSVKLPQAGRTIP